MRAAPNRNTDTNINETLLNRITGRVWRLLPRLGGTDTHNVAHAVHDLLVHRVKKFNDGHESSQFATPLTADALWESMDENHQNAVMRRMYNDVVVF